MIDVSIIVPVYNTEKYLDLCMWSLLNQTLDNIEIILVDDGSTDSSKEKCDLYAQKYTKVRTIHKKNEGLGMARNAGIKAASGKYIGFVDSDDVVNFDMYNILYKRAEENEAEISYVSYCRFSDDANIRKRATINRDEMYRNIQTWEGNEIKQYLLDRVGTEPNKREDNIQGASVCVGLFRRDIIISNNIFFVSERNYISEDMIFDIDVVPLCNRIVRENIELYYYRVTQNSLTTTYKRNRFQENVKLYYEMKRKMLERYNENECCNALNRYFIVFTRIAIIQEANNHGSKADGNPLFNIRQICANKELKRILHNYEYRKLPLKYRVMCYAEKKGYAVILLMMSYAYKIVMKQKH